MDPELRHLRSFVVVAQELNFTRAAELLHIAQTTLSSQIGQLEQRIGCPLLLRTSRRVELTPAGRYLLDATHITLRGLDDALRETRAVGRGVTGRLRVGYTVLAALELTNPILTSFQARHPQIELQLRLAPYDDPSAGLRDDDVDVAIVRRPIQGPFLFCDLFREARVAGLPAGHTLAARHQVSFDELRSEPIIADPGPDQIWRDYWLAADQRTGEPAVVEAKSFEDELALIALGRAINITTAGAARLYPRTGIRYVPVNDLSPCTIAIAWNPSRVPPLLPDFLDTANQSTDAAEAAGAFSRHGWSRPS